MKNLLLTALIALLASFVGVKVFMPSGAATAAKETAYARVMRTGVLRCGYYFWEPFMYKDIKTGAILGVNNDFIQEIGKLLGLKIEWVAEADMATIAQDLKTNKYDAFCTSIWPNAARFNNMLLTQPEVYSAAYAFVRADDTRFDGNLNKINDKSVTIAIFDGDFTEDVAKQSFPQAKTFSMPVNGTGGDMLVALANGKADIAIVDLGIYHQFSKNNPNKIRPIDGVRPVRIFGEHLAVPLGEFQLKNMLDMAIATLNQNTVFADILKTYEAQGYILSSFAPQPPQGN
ncbi:MAG: transporter substrate-binding domain-containing protein [Alphaproteobacteria bacterium]